MKDTIVTTAILEDIPDLIELLRQLFVIEKDFVFNENAHQQALSLLIKNKSARLVCARLQGKIVGMINTQRYISTAIGGESVIVEDVIIDYNYRNQGIGRAMLEEVESWSIARGIKRMQLVADIDNLKAIKFYQHLGWTSSNLKAMYKYL